MLCFVVVVVVFLIVNKFDFAKRRPYWKGHSIINFAAISISLACI